ncbi:MAG: hypothetical protein ACLFNN_03250 [Candidatus Paceibacterota bacterium]
MPIEDIEEKILKDSETECEDIRKRVSRSIEALEKEKEKEMQKMREAYEKKLEKEIEGWKNRVISKVKQRSYLEKESIIREKVDIIFKNKYDSLISEGPKQYTETIKQILLTQGPKKFKGLCSAPKERIKETEKALSEVSKVLDLDCNLKESETSIQGGLILENEDEYHDLSFETFISSIQTKEEEKIRSILAGS